MNRILTEVKSDHAVNSIELYSVIQKDWITEFEIRIKNMAVDATLYFSKINFGLFCHLTLDYSHGKLYTILKLKMG